MSTQLRWIAAAVAALAVGQASAQSYANPSYARGNGYGYGYTRVVRCESIGSRNNFCRVDTQGRVYVSRQLSNRGCYQGRNWSYNSRGIWVSGGCRADFAVVTRHNYRQSGYYGSNNGQGWYGRDGDYRYGNNDSRDGGDGYGNNDSRDGDRYDNQDDYTSYGDPGYYDQRQR